MTKVWTALLALWVSYQGGGTVHALRCGFAALGRGHSTNVHFPIPNRQKQECKPATFNLVISRSPLSSTTSSSSDLSGDVHKPLVTGKAASSESKHLETLASLPELYSVDARYNRRSPLTYDPASGRYLDAAQVESSSSKNEQNSAIAKQDGTPLQKLGRFLHSAFVPEGVSQTYYVYMRWRILQRFVNANVHVIGTQSLLMGLRGMQQSNAVGAAVSSAAKGGAALGAAAATNWVLKDTLGKVVRMAWASKMGRKFDPDAKRWRFRASLIYALGNGLEVSTYLHPQYFLVLAMLANSCKQMSMLTSSATRNALYNSFRRIESVTGGSSAVNVTDSNISSGGRRGSGGVENIGDITAKGEAQIAVVDLLGIGSGIHLSRTIGVSVQNVFAVWVILQIMEIFCMYHEMRSVVYKTFNFERMYTVLGKLLSEDGGGVESNCAANNSKREKSSLDPNEFIGHIPTPEKIAAEEKIFLPPDHLGRCAIAFGSPGRAALDPEELDMLINDIFRGEKYFLVVGEDVKNQRGLSARVRQWMRRRKDLCGDGNSEECIGIDRGIDPQEQCHIVLHADANNLDILKSALALVILRKKLKVRVAENHKRVGFPTLALRSRDCMDVLQEVRNETYEIFPQLLRELTKQGWRPPLRSMLGRVSTRADWPIQKKSSRQ
ncbi:hypothetical protein ACHAWF_007896 [Thalassiosira exigua]